MINIKNQNFINNKQHLFNYFKKFKINHSPKIIQEINRLNKIQILKIIKSNHIKISIINNITIMILQIKMNI